MSAQTRTFFTLILVLIMSSDLMAARRGLRVDFGAWGDGSAMGPPDCSDGSTTSGSVTWSGIRFVGSFLSTYNYDAYCQSPAAYVEGMSTSEYLNEDSVPEDEAGLAAKIGANTDNSVTAIRYSFLDRGRFDENVLGFQWAFYFFSNGVTLVALYGNVDLGAFNFDPYIVQSGEFLWDSEVDGFDGEYFCFNGTTFIGFWDGEGGGSPSAGCQIPTPPEIILVDGFEEFFE
jgi:hypothetical protein